VPLELFAMPEYNIDELDRRFRHARDFVPAPILQQAGWVFQCLYAQEQVEIEQSIRRTTVAPSTDPADLVAALTWLEMHGKV
jgi:hypothetical protein